MGFAAGPLALVLGALATALVIFLLYWLRPEPQPVRVPSNLIWSRVLDERRRREDFWRWLISLAIALVVGLAVVLALSQPIPEGGVTATRTVLVMDTSPSLLARLPDGETRWDRAVEHGRRLVGSGNELSEFLILDTAGQRGGRSFAGRREAIEGLESLTPVQGAEHRFPDLADLLEPPGGGAPTVDVIFVGDGVRVAETPPSVRRVSVFEPVPNVAITAFDVRPLPTDPGRFEAFIEVVRHAEDEADDGVVALQLDGVGGASVRRALAITPGEPRGETIPLSGFVAGPVRAVVAAAGEDGLTADNEAHAYIPARNRLRVLFAAGGETFWEAALQLDPRVSLMRPAAPDDPFADFDPAEVDLVVIEDAAPPTEPGAPVLFAGGGSAGWLPPRLADGSAETEPGSEDDAGAETNGDETRAAAVTLPVLTERADHPLLHGLDFGDALAPASSPFDAAALLGGGEARGWDLLLGDARLGLLAVRELPFRALAFPFPLADSNLPLQADFPVFLSRALSWLTDVDVRKSDLGLVRVAAPPGGAVFDGEGRPVAARRVGSEMVFEATAPSLYYLAGAGREIVVAASLLDREVSDLNRSAWVGEPVAPLASGRTPGEALWPWLALVALLLLVLEWVAFHRHATV